MDDVARVDQPQADPAADRRGDVAVRDLQLGIVDLGLVGLDRAFALPDQGQLSVELLLGDRLGTDQRVVAIQVELGDLEPGLIADQVAFGLLLHHVVGPRVDLGQQVALFDELPFGEIDLHQFTVDANLERDGV